MGGIEAIQILRRSDAKIPIVVLTGHGDSMTAVAATRAGADEFLIKPVSVEGLLQALHDAIATRRRLSARSPESSSAKARDAPAPSPVPPPMLNALGELVSSYCHDINNALAASLTYLEVASLTVRENEDLDMAIQAQARAIAHVGSLHAFVRTLYPEDMEPLRSITKPQLEAMIRAMYDNAGARGRLRVDVSELSDVWLPAVLLNALLYPTLSNAIEASAAPGALRLIGRLSIDDAQRTLQLSVADNGPGWPKPPDAILAGLWINSRYTTKGEGRGNGLRNLHRLISRLGGGLHIENRRRGGATVIVRVPLAGVVYEQ